MVQGSNALTEGGTRESVQRLRSHELQPCARGGRKPGLRAIQDAQQRMHALCSDSIGSCSGCPQLLVQQQLPHLAQPGSSAQASEIAPARTERDGRPTLHRCQRRFVSNLCTAACKADRLPDLERKSRDRKGSATSGPGRLADHRMPAVTDLSLEAA